MSLRARVDRLFESLGWGELWDGANMEDFARHGCTTQGHRKHAPGPIPYGVQRAAMFSAFRAIKIALEQPSRWRNELEGTRKSDVYRKERGWPLSLRDGREQWFLDRIAGAEAKALQALDQIGLAEDATPDQVREALLNLGRESGLTPAEMAKLEHCVKPRKTASG
jgi:hypothetical protein